MCILLRPDSGRIWALILLISLTICVPIWIVTNCMYYPQDLGSLSTICGQPEQTNSETNFSTPLPILSRNRRSVIPATEPSPPLQVAITKKEGRTILWYNTSNTHVATFLFDYCDIAPCPGPVWQCLTRRYQGPEIYICVQDNYWGSACKYWKSVGWNTGKDWGYRPQSALDKKDKNGKSLISRMTLLWRGIAPSRCLPAGYEPDRSEGDVRLRTGGIAYQLTLNIENPQKGDEGIYLMGQWMTGGTDRPLGEFELRDMYKAAEWEPVKQPSNPLTPHFHTLKDMVAIADPTYEDTLAMETGFSDTNFWLEWMKYNARKHNKSDCYVCGKARPHLGTVPLNIPRDQEECFLNLFTNATNNNTVCKRWRQEYPILSKNPNPGNTITIYPGNYTCYVSNTSKARDLKSFPPGYCSEKRNTTIVTQTKSLGDIYWICGDMKIRTKLDTPWKGECALAKIIMPLHILHNVSSHLEPSLPQHSRRRRESPKGSFDPHVYIDAIGVPRGVPNEFKARDQVAAGFESILTIVTANKNVDWINYIYYNQQRFVNDTKDALKGLAEQLESASQMTFQNRMALDMILAAKGGTCTYIDKIEGCCTYIPDNTGPNGKVTLAIQKLEDLSVELKKNSGIDNPWDQYFGWFTNWKQVLVQMGIILIVIFVSLCVFVYCVVPCFRKILAHGTRLCKFSIQGPEENYELYIRAYGARGKV